MKFNAGFLLQTIQTTFSPNEKLPAATFFLRASMLGTIDSLLSVMLCYSKYGATGMKGTRRAPSVVLPTLQVSYYVVKCGLCVSGNEIEQKLFECLKCTMGQEGEY